MRSNASRWPGHNTTTPIKMLKPTFATVLWLAALLAVLAGVALGMVVARERIIRELGSRQSLEEWRRWSHAEQQRQTDAGRSAERRPPKSAAPPALVLMRDHFPILMTAALVFSALLFGILSLLLRGAWRLSREKSADR